MRVSMFVLTRRVVGQGMGIRIFNIGFLLALATKGGCYRLVLTIILETCNVL